MKTRRHEDKKTRRLSIDGHTAILKFFIRAVPSLLRQCHEKAKISKAKVSPYNQLEGEAGYFLPH